MKPRNLLAGGALLLGATTALIAGHDVLVRHLYGVFAAAELPAAARIASPTAALLVHLIAGIFVLPLLRRTGAILARGDTGRIAVTTAMVAVILRTVTEMATGVIVVGLPLFSMAAVSVGIAIAPTLRAERRARRARAFAPRLVRGLARRAGAA